MELEEILSLEGMKLLDTNTFEPRGGDFLYQLYDCRNIDELPSDLLISNINHLRMVRNIIFGSGALSIEEVGKELDQTLIRCNDLINFYHKGPGDFSPGRIKTHNNFSRVGEAINHNRRRSGIMREKKRPDFEIDRVVKKENLIQLNLLAKELGKSIEFVSRTDVRKTFSREEWSIYNHFFEYFSFICERYNLSRDSHERYALLKSRNPCQFETDVKLVATAFTLASRDKVILASSDGDLNRLVAFFYGGEGYKERFKVKNPNNDVFLFADYNGECYRIIDFISRRKHLKQIQQQITC